MIFIPDYYKFKVTASFLMMMNLSFKVYLEYLIIKGEVFLQTSMTRSKNLKENSKFMSKFLKLDR